MNPRASLDSETERRRWRCTREAESTCLAVTYRRAVIERADQILVLAAAGSRGTPGLGRRQARVERHGAAT